MHIDEKGHVTAYTGKVEIGQNIRTSLAQTVADELRVPLTAVTMVTADTDLTPYDAGTFGSQTTPRMAPVLARAAASAREMLIDQAAARLQVDRQTLTAKDAQVIGAGGRTVKYGELTQGQKLTGTVAAEPALTPPTQWTVRGTAPKKVDGRDFVTGRHQYTPDIVRPSMLYGRVIRPDGYDGNLISADDGAARQIPGVVVVRDGDLLGVVAPTERVARKAASLVRAQWRLPADQPSSTTIYEHLKKTEQTGGRNTPTVVGDVAQARSSSAKTFDASYHIPYIAHVPLEPRSAVAEWTDGKLTVGAVRNGRSASAASSRKRSGSRKLAFASSCPTWAPPTAASIPANTRSKQPASRRRPASR